MRLYGGRAMIVIHMSWNARRRSAL